MKIYKITEANEYLGVSINTLKTLANGGDTMKCPSKATQNMMLTCDVPKDHTEQKTCDGYEKSPYFRHCNHLRFGEFCTAHEKYTPRICKNDVQIPDWDNYWSKLF